MSKKVKKYVIVVGGKVLDRVFESYYQAYCQAYTIEIVHKIPCEVREVEEGG